MLIKGRELVSVKLYNNTTLDLSQPQYDTIETIGFGVFRNCKKLQSVKFPSELKAIESCAFEGCSALAEIKLPDSTIVENCAFAGCHRLKQVYLPHHVDFSTFMHIYGRLWYTQFDDCDSVTFVLPDASIPNKFSKDENGILRYEDEPIFFNEVSPTCNHEDSLLYIRDGVVYRRDMSRRRNVLWSVSSQANTEHSIDEQYGNVAIIINADSIEYAPPANYIFFRNTRKLTELHLSNCNYSKLPELALTDFAMSRITLYVPWGCRKYYEANSEYAAFKEIREDGWWRRMANLLTEMWQSSIITVLYYPVLGYIGIGIILFALGVIYYLRFKNLLRHNSDNRSRNVLRWRAALTAISTVFFFVLAWMSVYWLVFFNLGTSLGYAVNTNFLGHVLGLVFGTLAVRIIVFNKTDWTALKRSIRELIARTRHMTGQEWKQYFIDLTEAFRSYLARVIRCFMSHTTRVIRFMLYCSMIIIAFGISWSLWSLKVSEIINQLDKKVERASTLESVLYDKLSGRYMLLTPKQKGQLRDYYCNRSIIDAPYKVLLDSTIGLGHTDDVNSVSFSPDGKYIATTSYDNTAIVWDANSGKTIHTLKHQRMVNDVGFSPDGKYIVTASWDGTAIVWDANSGKAIYTLKHQDDVNSAAFSPDGKYIVTGSYDHTAIVWDANSGKAIHTLKHQGSVNDVGFSPDGKYIVTGSSDHTAIVWDANSGKAIYTLKHQGSVYDVGFSPDGKYIVTVSSDHTAIVWDANSGKVIHRLKHQDRVYDVGFSPDGKYIVTAPDDNTAIVWDANSGKAIHTLKHQSRVYDVGFNPDGKYIVTASGDNTAIVWDANTGNIIHILSDIRSSHILRCAPDGSRLVAANPYNWNKAFLLNRSGDVTDTLNHAAEIRDILFLPKADRFVTIGGDKVLVWDKRGGKRDSLYHVGVTGVSFCADGKRIISSSDQEMRAWDRSGMLVDSLEKLGRSNIVYHLGAKRKMAVENADSSVIVYDLLKGDSLVLDSTRYMDGVESVCISPDGKHIVTAIDPMYGKDEVKAIVWSPDGTFEQELKFNNTYASISDISYSWNGRYILGHKWGEVFIWDADTGMLLWRIDDDVMDFETAKSIDANREVTFVTREKDIKRVRLLSLKEMIEMRRQQLNTDNRDKGAKSDT